MGFAPSNLFEMAKYNDLPVYKATYDLLLSISRFIKEFSGEDKYIVSKNLKNGMRE